MPRYKKWILNPTIQNITLATACFAMALSLYEHNNSLTPSLGAAGELVASVLDYLLGLTAWISIALLSNATLRRIRHSYRSFSHSLTEVGILLSIAALFGSEDGGLIGGVISILLETLLGYWGSQVLFGLVLLVSIASILGHKPQKWWLKIVAAVNRKPRRKASLAGLDPSPQIQTPEQRPVAQTKEVIAAKGPELDKERVHKVVNRKDYSLPSLNLLDPPQPHSIPDDEFLKDLAKDLRGALRSFDISAKVEQWVIGPMATTFFVQTAPGTKASKLQSSIEDIARFIGLNEEGIRISGNVVGERNTIGLEIPNPKRRTCVLREVLENPSNSNTDSALPIALGVGIGGDYIWGDLAKYPHLMIAGSTGSGKSVALNAILLSLLFKLSPWNLQLLLIDPKAVEFSLYRGIPHLYQEVITEMEDAVDALENICEVMDQRYQLLSEKKVRNIEEYNQLKMVESSRVGTTHDATAEKSMSYIVVFIDELADLMITYGNKAADPIGRISQKARAAGIHLVLATQRPTSDVINGLIKTNVPARLAFRVSSNVDSRVIIQDSGAEKLLGHGDCLLLTPFESRLKRMQAPLVMAHEVQKVVSAISQL